MKLVRTSSFKKSFSARTSGRLTRSIKRSVNPYYGKKGAGWLHPRRKLYNEVYQHSTIGINPMSNHHSRSRTGANGGHWLWLVAGLILVIGLPYLIQIAEVIGVIIFLSVVLKVISH